MYSIAMTPEPRTTGSLVWHLAMRWRTEVDRAVAHLGLTHAQYSLLASLHAMAGRGIEPTQRELASYATLQPIYVSKLIRSLEALHLVTRRPDPLDSRAMRLRLTDAGGATAKDARSIVAELDRRLTAPLDGDAAQALAAALAALLDAAGPIPPDPVSAPEGPDV